MIKFILTEFDEARLENIWLLVLKQGPRSARSVDHDPEPNIFPSGPTIQSISAQYFGFVRHSFITNDVIEHEKCYSFFLNGTSGFSVYRFERFDFQRKIDHSTNYVFFFKR